LEIKQWLDQVDNFAGIAVEKITFDEKGLLDAGADAFLIKTVKDGKFVIVG